MVTIVYTVKHFFIKYCKYSVLGGKLLNIATFSTNRLDIVNTTLDIRGSVLYMY